MKTRKFAEIYKPEINKLETRTPLKNAGFSCQ